MRISCLIVAALLCANSVFAAPFLNLGFDTANTNNVQFIFGAPPFDGLGPANELLQFWQVLSGTNGTPVTEMQFNPVSSLTPNRLALIDQQAATRLGVAIDGPFTLQMTASSGIFTISQRGDIPSDAIFLIHSGGGLFDIAINGTPIPRFEPFNPTSRVYDISSFAGQNVELSFTARPSGLVFPGQPGGGFLDNVVFVIPEPSTWALMTLGGIGILWQLIRGGARKRS